MLRCLFCVAAYLAVAACSGDETVQNDDASTASSAQAPAGDGQAFFPVEWNAEDGSVVISLPAADEDGVALRAIHTSGVTSGLGSNPVGLDRGYQDSGRIIAFRRVGQKVYIEEENWRYRASADNPLEKKAVLDSFARSLLWSVDVIDEQTNGGFTVDLSGFLISDTLNLTGWLKSAGQGSFSIVPDRSFTDPETILVFPDNVEIDTVVTLTSDAPGPQVVATAASPRSPTLKIHHSFVRLPPPGYTPRFDDPRVGAIDIVHYDFSTPLDERIIQRVARRFRLEREDPAADSGPVKKPIVFYVDSGAPEAVRAALIDGASWWAEAFEEAGFEDAFRVEVLPEDVHPFDIRYNVIQWTHRQTRGWSYGGGVHDPRTGEMLKGHVILGSQRVRQDRMIFEGLAGADKSRSGSVDDPVQIALARIRQLSAHEVGHPLGFEHNFAASSIDRASVMDYPAPYVRPDGDGGLDLSGAYAVGAGAWDKFTVNWLYSQFPEGVNESEALNQIVMDGYASGLRFVADSEGRSIGTAHPDGSVWDNGNDPVATLRETMAVRRIALDNFGLNVIQNGRPVSELRAVIVPIYLFHRYQIDAAAKLIGGYRFDYALKGDGRHGGTPVAPDRQRAALAALLSTIEAEALTLPDDTLNLLTPEDAAFSGVGASETFSGATGSMFDLTSAADAAATLTLRAILHPERLARVAEFSRRDGQALSVNEILTDTEATLFASTSAALAPIARTVQSRYVSNLIDLSSNESLPAATLRSDIDVYLKALRTRLAPGLLSGSTPNRAHREWLIDRIDAHLRRPVVPGDSVVESPKIPPGSPIGASVDLMETCWHCDPIQ